MNNGSNGAIRSATVDVDGLSIFYREAGEAGNPKLVLLHGFPSSSHQYRDLIPALSDEFRVISMDYPGFGNSDMPDPASFPYTFDKTAEVVENFLETKGFTRFGLYVQDYGGPVGFRVLARHPEWLEWLIIQNTNAYEEGFTAAWDGFRNALWKNRTPDTEEPLAAFLEVDAIKSIYLHGQKRAELISPDNWNMDAYFMGALTLGACSSTSSTTTARTSNSIRSGRSSCAPGSRRRSSSGVRTTSSSRRKAATPTCATSPTLSSTSWTPATSPSRIHSRRSRRI